MSAVAVGELGGLRGRVERSHQRLFLSHSIGSIGRDLMMRPRRGVQRDPNIIDLDAQSESGLERGHNVAYELMLVHRALTQNRDCAESFIRAERDVHVGDADQRAEQAVDASTE
jgi:hypothetical protein